MGLEMFIVEIYGVYKKGRGSDVYSRDLGYIRKEEVGDVYSRDLGYIRKE